MRILLDLSQPWPDDTKFAVSYLRVSTEAQTETGYDEEGLSIAAQREANQKKAEQLGAVIVAEFVDAAESAKTADRPDLQAMLAFISDMRVISYVIVDKVDRLARNREDDVLITMAVRKAGAQFVSSKENIDETPSGRLLHGIMASIAEFYSANLATESKKGMRQKAKSGGTPGHAPLGYLNVRERIDGREIRTVIVDEKRAPHIQWMFTAYATGDWTMRQLEEELDRRGLRIPATKKLPERKVSYQHIDKMLSNRYYTGFVSYEGIWYEGRHPALVDQATFDRVQAIRTARAQAREKVRKHPHYLKGSIFCGRCDARLGVMNAKNRWNTVYPYFYCLGRAKDRTSCSQSTVLISDVEASVVEYWSRVQLSPERIAAIREQVMVALVQRQQAGQAEVKRQEHRRQDLRNAQLKLIEMRYADAIPLDLLKSEQERITRELAAAQEIIDRYSTEMDSVLNVIEEALLLCANAHRLYHSAPPTVRRQLNQAVFARLLIVDDQVQGADLTGGFAHLLSSHLATEPGSEGGGNGSARPDTARERPPMDAPDGPWAVVERPYGPLPTETKNPGPNRDRGSNDPTLVSQTGLILNPALVRYIRERAGQP